MTSSAATPNYPSNAKTKVRPEKEEEQKESLKKVVSGSVKERKKPIGRRLAETFTGDDAKSVGEYILFDVMVPAAKSMIADAASQGTERLLFGEVRRPRTSGTRVYSSAPTNYNKVRSGVPADRRGFSDTRQDGYEISRRGRASHDFREVVLDSRADAEVVIDNMMATLEQYDVVTVSDFYDLIGITGNFTDEKYGWVDLRQAHVVRTRDGYIVNLPKPVALD